MFIVPVYAVLRYTVAKHGLYRVSKRIKSTTFTYDASIVFLKFDGNKNQRGSVKTYLPLCTLPSTSADFAGMVIL